LVCDIGAIVKLDDFDSAILLRAIKVYLESAYPSGEVSEEVRRRASVASSPGGVALLADERFERLPAEAAVEKVMRFNLRLGNERYPHMKLGIDRVSGSEHFVLMVDTHDKHFAKMVQQTEQADYKALLDHNDGLKRSIERAWTDAGLPTFENYLRNHLAELHRPGQSSKG
jgi:hypothetical protein